MSLEYLDGLADDPDGARFVTVKLQLDVDLAGPPDEMSLGRMKAARPLTSVSRPSCAR